MIPRPQCQKLAYSFLGNIGKAEAYVHKSYGFTLIELLLVLAIIGIISAIAVPTLLHQQQKAKRLSLHDHTVIVIADLASVLGELSDPPSERKSGYPTRVYNGSSEDNQAKAQDAISIVLGRSNFANARNPYSGATGGYSSNTAPSTGSGVLGLVYLDASTANTTSSPVITIVGVFRNSKGNLDQVRKTASVN